MLRESERGTRTRVISWRSKLAAGTRDVSKPLDVPRKMMWSLGCAFAQCEATASAGWIWPAVPPPAKITVRDFIYALLLFATALFTSATIAGLRKALDATKPTPIYVAMSAEPPYETRGSVTPTTGSKLSAEPILSTD